MGTLLHPYDRSSRSLLQAVDSGRLPRALLDGLPLRYVDGAVLAEVRDYRGCHAAAAGGAGGGHGAALPRAYVAVMHPTTSTVAADAEELCAALDLTMPVTGRGCWANLGGVIGGVDGGEEGGRGGGGGGGGGGVSGGGEGDRKSAGAMDGANGGANGGASVGASGGGGGGKTDEEKGEKSSRLRDMEAAGTAAAALQRRLAVEGALLAATSAPLCLDPDPLVAARRRAVGPRAVSGGTYNPTPTHFFTLPDRYCSPRHMMGFSTSSEG